MRRNQRIGTDQPDDKGNASTIITSSANSGSNDISTRARAWSRAQIRRPSQQADRGGGRQQQKPGFDGPGEPRIAPVLSDELPGMQQQQCPKRARQHEGAKLDSGRTEGQNRHRQEDREHRLLSADNGARQQVQRPERRYRTKLRQQIHAEHVIARRAKRDIGEPERQRRAEIGSHLVFPAISEHGGEVARRAAVQQHRHKQPQRRLRQHHKPDYQPRPGADQFDNQGCETHETSEKLNAGA